MSAAASPAELAALRTAVAASATLTDQEFAFSGADFERVRQLIYQHAGISLHAGKHAMVYSRLSRRLRVTGHRSFASYLKALESDAEGAPEWQEFVNALTTNLTAFFREGHHFEALAQALKSGSSASSLRIWCNAASTGEEPCSIAMVVAETLGAGAPVTIVATDIDTQVLETARRGVYAADARGLTPQRLAAHFLRGTGANAGFIRIRPQLARLIDYRSHNLIDPAVGLGADAPPGGSHHFFDRGMEIGHIGPWLLVDDHQVCSQSFGPPVFLGSEDVANDSPVLGLIDSE